MRALEDITYDRRKDFISRHRLPVDELPIDPVAAKESRLY